MSGSGLGPPAVAAVVAVGGAAGAVLGAAIHGLMAAAVAAELASGAPIRDPPLSTPSAIRATS